MLFKAVAAALFATTSVLAAPLQARQPDYFLPSATWKYNVKTGSIWETDEGVVFKDEYNQGNDITALVTFTYPDAAQGKKCQFAFYLDQYSGLSGSGKLDLFTTRSPAPGPRESWGPGNQRDVNLGRLSATKSGLATWDATFGAYLTQKTDCKAPGTQEGFELVGVYDRDYVNWDPKSTGPRIVIS